jgi:predicted Fe-S protein YdhL (DUF1289 family)
VTPFRALFGRSWSGTPAASTEPELSDSPCVKVCKLDFDSRLCVGRRRTAAEILDWPNLAKRERRAILRAC